jgi:hypothetical protein
MGTVQATRDHIERQLRAYGEEAVAMKLADVSDEDYDRISQRAFDYACQSSTPSGRGMLLDMALARAAVEVIEGAPRELRRKRRVYV